MQKVTAKVPRAFLIAAITFVVLWLVGFQILVFDSNVTHKEYGIMTDVLFSTPILLGSASLLFPKKS